MAASKGFTGKGTTLSIGSGGQSETFTAIAQLKTIQFGGQKIDFDEISNLDSPQMGTSGTLLRERMPSAADAGTLDASGVFLPGDAGQLALDTAYKSGALTDFKIQLPKGPGQATTGNLYAFSAYLAERPLPDVQFDKTVTFKMKLQLTTDITITPGS
jgi:hypothetical protein